MSVPEDVLYRLAGSAVIRLDEVSAGAYDDSGNYWRVEGPDEEQRDYLVLSRSTQAGLAETVRVRVSLEEIR